MTRNLPTVGLGSRANLAQGCPFPARFGIKA